MSNILRSGTDASDTPDEGPPVERRVDPAIVDAATERTALDRARLYSLLALGFERPGDDHEALLADGTFAAELRDAADGYGDAGVREAAEAVGSAIDSREELAGDWASLFGVEEGVTVSPYELTYLPGPLVTNVRQLADINGFYEAFELSVAEGEYDRNDHVCFEAEFLSHLSLREARLRSVGDEVGVHVVVDARRQFVEDHLGRWFWRFADEVGAHADGFYAALADLLAALVEAEIDRLDLDPDWVPDDPEAAEWTEGIFGDSGRSCGSCGITPDADAPGLDADVPRGPPGADEPIPGDELPSGDDPTPGDEIDER